MTVEYEKKAVQVIGSEFRIEMEKVVRALIKKYPVLEGIRVPFFDIFIKKQKN